MEPVEIIAQPFVQRVAGILKKLEDRGLCEACVAGGWTRCLLLDLEPTDIDVSYVGELRHQEGRQHLADILREAGEDTSLWDINGIWNAEQAYGIKHTEENFLLYYISSIDSVYLASDGKLHDPTGNGFADAKNKILRLNTFELENRPRSAQKSVFVAVEACRRAAQFDLKPTLESTEMMREAVRLWPELLPEKQVYILARMMKKFGSDGLQQYKAIYAKYGWSFLIDLVPDVSVPAKVLGSAEF